MYVCCVLFLSCALVLIPFHYIASAASRGESLGERQPLGLKGNREGSKLGRQAGRSI